MSFEDDWKKESEAVIKATQETVKVTAISLFNGVILSSPVGNADLWENPNSAPPGYVGGRFRSNWFLSFDSPSTETTESRRGRAASLRKVAGIASLQYSDTYILTNNLPYAQRIENGWSSQSPQGVVAPNESRIERQVPKFYKAALKKYGAE